MSHIDPISGNRIDRKSLRSITIGMQIGRAIANTESAAQKVIQNTTDYVREFRKHTAARKPTAR